MCEVVTPKYLNPTNPICFSGATKSTPSTPFRRNLITSGAVNVACRHAVEGRSLYDHADEKLGELKLIVVGSFAPESSEYKDLVGDILKENKVELHSIDELQSLIEEIQTTGKKVTELPF